MSHLCAVILAAGEGKRMKSNRPKVLSPVLFKPMLGWVVDAAKKAGIGDICVVTGYMHEDVERYLNKLPGEYETVFQHERKGTGHAVMTAAEFLKKYSGSDVLILNGDSPFIDSGTIERSHELHIGEGNAVTVISAELENPFGYGRIVRDSMAGTLKAIVEQKDANERVQAIREINSGAYWFDVDALLSVLYDINNQNAQGEYYLPDAIKLLIERGLRADAFIASNGETVLGANDCLQLHDLNGIARKRILNALMKNGIDIPCTDGVIVGPDVTVEQNVCLLPGTILCGQSYISSGCVLGPNTYIENSNIGCDAKLSNVSCVGHTVRGGETLGPFVSLLGENW